MVGHCLALTRIPSSLWPIVSLFKPRKACIQAVRTFALYADRTTVGVLDVCNGALSEKTPQIFWLSLPVEYVIWLSGRKDAVEVRYWLTDKYTHRPNYSNPCCACAQRVNDDMNGYIQMWRVYVRTHCFCGQHVYLIPHVFPHVIILLRSSMFLSIAHPHTIKMCT